MENGSGNGCSTFRSASLWPETAHSDTHSSERAIIACSSYQMGGYVLHSPVQSSGERVWFCQTLCGPVRAVRPPVRSFVRSVGGWPGDMVKNGLGGNLLLFLLPMEQPTRSIIMSVVRSSDGRTVGRSVGRSALPSPPLTAIASLLGPRWVAGSFVSVDPRSRQGNNPHAAEGAPKWKFYSQTRKEKKREERSSSGPVKKERRRGQKKKLLIPVGFFFLLRHKGGAIRPLDRPPARPGD